VAPEPQGFSRGGGTRFHLHHDPSWLDVCTRCAYNEIVAFEWDEAGKAGLSFRKHGVRLPEAIPAFDDPHAITVTDDESDPNERRFVTLGMRAKNTRHKYERSLRL
jgi:hypothetical protein